MSAAFGQTTAHFTKSATAICQNDSITFTNETTSSLPSEALVYEWGIGGADPSYFGGITPPPIHFSHGLWTVTLVVRDTTGTVLDMYSDTVRIHQMPFVGSGAPITGAYVLPCRGDSLEIVGWATIPGSTVSLIDDDMTTLLVTGLDTVRRFVHEPQAFWLNAVSAEGCATPYVAYPIFVQPSSGYGLWTHVTPSAFIHSYTAPGPHSDTVTISLAPSSQLSAYHSFGWDTSATYSFLWNTGETAYDKIISSGTGLYSVRITESSNGCQISDSIYVIVDSTSGLVVHRNYAVHDIILDGHQTHARIASFTVTNYSSMSMELTKLITGINEEGATPFISPEWCVSGISFCPGHTSGPIPITNVVATSVMLAPFETVIVEVFADFNFLHRFNLTLEVEAVHSGSTVSDGVIAGQIVDSAGG